MSKPNILFLMADQVQGRVLNADHPCKTPNLDGLAARGVRFTKAYPAAATCLPSRGSLMTGLLPHNHGMIGARETARDMGDDRLGSEKQYSHWAQLLRKNGYNTGYFGKWNLGADVPLQHFGWQEFDLKKASEVRQNKPEEHYRLEGFLNAPPGYHKRRFYGVTDLPIEYRGMGIWTKRASEFLDDTLAQDGALVLFCEPD